jgi:HEAT repeat protein
MNQSLAFAQSFAQLVWVLLNEGRNVEAQKKVLRSAVTASLEGPISFTLDGWKLIVNGEPAPDTLRGAQDLVAQLTGHAVSELLVRQRAVAADVLAVARALATEPVPGRGGRDLTLRLDELGVRSIWVVVDIPLPSDADVRRATNPKGIPVIAAPDPAPAPRTKPPVGLFTDESSGTYRAFAKAAPGGSIEELVTKLGQTTAIAPTVGLLDGIVMLVENAVRQGKSHVIADGMSAIVRAGEAATKPNLKRSCEMALRRLNRPAVLRALARLLSREPERVDACIAILGQMGEDGAEALIEELTPSQSLAQQKIFFDAIVRLKAGVPALLHMLGDSRAHVVQNAADLLGEMQTAEASGPIGELLRHNDERIRRAAAGALGKIATTTALRALNSAIRDSSPQVRLVAAAGLASRRETTAAHTLTRALDQESDDAVQLQIIAALGRVATAEAVQRLIKLAMPSGKLFKRRPAAIRLAAIQALGTARTPAALEALAELRKRGDRATRHAAEQAIAGSTNDVAGNGARV